MDVLPRYTPTVSGNNPWFVDIIYDHWDPIILAIIGLISITFLLVGQRIMRVFIFSVAFCIGSLGTFILFETRIQAPELTKLHRYIISGAVGVALGIAAVCLLYIGCLVIGGYLGFLVATLILMISLPGFRVMDLFNAMWQMYLFVAVLAVIGMIVCSIKRCQRVLLILVSAAAGGLGVVFIVDYFIDAGFAYVVETLLSLPIHKEQPEFNFLVWALIALWVVLSAAGVVIQTRWTSDTKHKTCKHEHHDAPAPRAAPAAKRAGGRAAPAATRSAAVDTREMSEFVDVEIQD